MIVKHIPMNNQAKSSFAGLVNYITDTQNKSERVDFVNVSNCQSHTLKAATCEVLAVQHQNTRATGDKTYHLIVSFRAGETPNERTLKEIEKRVCDSLGYSEHQRISAVHTDTDNMHIHIAINKIHPKTKTMHEPFKAYKTLAGIAEILEQDYSLEQDNHKTLKTLAEGKAEDMECHSGVESLKNWIRRECLEDMATADSWKAIHALLNEKGVELKTRGNGLVFESGGVQVKASTVGRQFSKSNLEVKFGEYKPSTLSTPKKGYVKKPTQFKVNTTELYAQYLKEQNNNTVKKKIALANLRKRKEQKIGSAKIVSKFKRKGIKLLKIDHLAKKVLYSQTHALLGIKLKEIHEQARLDRKAVHEQYARLSWADWLRSEAVGGNSLALDALRAREQSNGLKGNNIQASGEKSSDKKTVIDGITKKGTQIYKGKIRDDGHRVKVTGQVTDEQIKEALEIVKSKYGKYITLNGTPNFQSVVVEVAAKYGLDVQFKDKYLEAERVRKAEGSNMVDKACDKYIEERQAKRDNGLDILNHVKYSKEFEGIEAQYSGVRNIDGQALALLKVEDKIIVKSIDKKTVNNLKRVKIGTQIIVKKDEIVIGKLNRKRE